ncbi:MAG: divalent-cation tolerance protein CutA [Candidatus Omnitrophota bacterium]|jgi:periplasmic divalent cation tolerance protein|nr:divalent-cation tolerance protein CutA [Candidatus Omnitrophota bacterium]|tara:strand:- start:586 stop:900 length:315 start_codon:yes stop_codon:yes gene_type:complete
MHVVVFITTVDKKEAQKISNALLDKHLIACSNIIEGIESQFWWQGKKENAKESLVIAKTKKSSMEPLIKVVKSIHSYEVPEVIAIPIIDGYKPYLDWLEKESSG